MGEDATPAPTPADRVREVIVDLAMNRVPPKVLSDLDTAVARAKRDGAVIGRR